MNINDNFVIFRNYSVRGYWEISGYSYTTYLMHEMLLSDQNYAVDLMLSLHGLDNIDGIKDTLKKYTKDPQDDMFIVEIK